MLSFLRSALVAPLLFCLCLRLAVLADDTNSPAIPSELAAADQRYRSGKFADAEASYQALLKINPTLVLAQVGLVRSLLRQQKIDEALEAANTAQAAHPDSAALLAAKGDVDLPQDCSREHHAPTHFTPVRVSRRFSIPNVTFVTCPLSLRLDRERSEEDYSDES